MRCVVTAGPTYEPLDEVRRLTNFSTGRLGTELADRLARAGHSVVLLRGELATWPAEAAPGIERVSFTTTASLEGALGGLSSAKVDAVFHAAAVSDFRFGSVWQRGSGGELAPVRAGKLTTRGGSLLVELQPTPKLIIRLRDWFPQAWLGGWKYGVDGDRATLLDEARSQLTTCRTDVCVANGPAYGPGFGIVGSGPGLVHCADRTELGDALVALLREGRRAGE